MGTTEPTPSNRVVILGAGRGIRGDSPSAMVRIDGSSRVLDWLLAAFDVLDDREICFVAGYKANAIEREYRNVRYLFNADWETTGPVGSLSLAPLTSRCATFVSYSDVVFRSETVRRLAQAQGDVVLAVDRRWQVRYENRGASEMQSAEKVVIRDGRIREIGQHIDRVDAHAEFAGLAMIASGSVEHVSHVLESGAVDSSATIPQLIQAVLRDGLTVTAVDVLGDWAELNAPQDLARFVLGTKAESLERLRPLVRIGHIGASCTFSHGEWSAGADAILERIATVFPGSKVIVRSSAIAEDTWSASSAGAFRSIGDVDSSDASALMSAIDEVVCSYGEPQRENQVLVQGMLEHVRMAGVAMTRTPVHLGPYYVINFDDCSSRTDGVTSGVMTELRTVYLYRGAEVRPDLPSELGILRKAIAELEQLVGYDSLDVEFAFTDGPTPTILQVRPMAVGTVQAAPDDTRIGRSLERCQGFIRDRKAPAAFLVGDSSPLNVMSDWNPAEIIGVKPRRLALSLYRYLVTDEVWAEQRASYGYRDVRPNNLIVDILGHPFVDVRVTFNSFVPATLDDRLAARLVNFYLEFLAAHPECYDKVEFDVLFTSYSFDFASRALRLASAGFNAIEIEALGEALRRITREGIARLDGDLDASHMLAHRRSSILRANLPPLERMYALLADARRIGTPAFAHLARAGFIAVDLLNSLVGVGAINEEDKDGLLASVSTVSARFRRDAASVKAGRLAWDAFVDRYGHLRPGTYDITSSRYASAPEQYLRPVVEASGDPDFEAPVLGWNDQLVSQVSARFEAEFEGMSSGGGIDFIRRAIQGREESKFEFTRNLSEALESIAEFGGAYELSTEDLSHVRIEELFALRGVPERDIPDTLQRLVHDGREAFHVTQAVCLPTQIFHENDVMCFEQHASRPNYVSRTRTLARVALLGERNATRVDIAGKIVVLPNADPGYDWIFGRGIAGLVTAYGGVNSHMAIRAAELRLPAAIGVGATLFSRLGEAKVIELDCESQAIRIVS